ncbi:hemerythrin domain-containing protein [Blastococcus saxobsidens]|uniref:Hemerythrin domain-containing protein n=2 Tax=Blastococcus saxobsidens TaxID=138336 RepID=A0A6L9VXJ8_9ACTN|nr:hemerythrin domain-containing protein [Blastococcus saxobsidens]NEK84513.1 hemerythrin domain-containing protein [Blastococcus saxobsidens]
MRAVHARLRAAIEVARDSVEAGAGLTPPDRELLLHCWGFCAALDGHHRAEDEHLFPRIGAALPHLVPVLAQLRQDHAMIGHLLGQLGRALDEGAAAAEQLRHLDGIEAVMETHFRYEELRLLDVLDQVVPEGVTAPDLFGPLA